MNKQQMIEQFVIQDVVKLISEDEGCDFVEAMRRFYTSKVFAVLEDFETLLYRESPRYVWSIYKEEAQYGSSKQENFVAKGKTAQIVL